MPRRYALRKKENEWETCKKLLDALHPESKKTRVEKLQNLIEIQRAARAVEPIIAELKETIRDFQEREDMREDPLRDCPR